MRESSNFYDFTKGILMEFKYLLYTLFMFLEIDSHVFKILMYFMILDTITGVIKAFKIDKKEFSFNVLVWGLVSKLGILVIPLLVALLLKGIGKDMGGEFGVSLIMKILIVSEFISSISNLYTVKTGVAVKDIDIFTYLFKFLRCKALNLLKIYTKIEIKDDENCK